MTEPLKWVRWSTDTHRDIDLLDLPKTERWIWPTLVDLAGKAEDHGVLKHNGDQLAREADLTPRQVMHAVGHLIDRGRVRITEAGILVVNFNPRYSPPLSTIPPAQRPDGGVGEEEALRPIEQAERDQMLRELARGFKKVPKVPR